YPAFWFVEFRPSQSTFSIDEKILGMKLQEVLSAARSITSYECMEYVKEFASDKYEGRGTGTEGFKKAAGYTADEFRKFGLISPFGAKIQC
ncbi:hypothetical protein ACFL4T_14580, partial [candidate division KSB1 bacterium]